MELRLLKTFQVVATELNLTKAARQLGYTQPTITLQIQALEEQLQHKLLVRNGRKAQLTLAGKQLKIRVDELLALLQVIEAEMQALNKPSGSVTIAAPTYYVDDRLALILNNDDVAEEHLRVHMLPLDSENAIQAVLNGISDVAIVGKEVSNPKLNSTILEYETAYLVVAKNLLLHDSIDNILAQKPFLTYEENCNLAQVTRAFIRENKLKPATVLTIAGGDVFMAEAVLNNIGYAILSEKMVRIHTRHLEVIRQISQPIITSVIMLKNRQQEPNIFFMQKLLKANWSLERESYDA